MGVIFLADLLADATQDNVVELEEGGSMAQREPVYAISHGLIDEGVASQHVVEYVIGHGVAPRMQSLVDLRKLALHVTQRLLDGFQVQAIGVHRPGPRTPGYRMVSAAAMVRSITCGARRI